VCLALLASVFAVWPVLRRDRYAGAREEAEARDAQNLGAYKAEREELDAARTAGVLPEDEYRALIVEMDRRLLQDADADDAAALATRSGGRRLLLAVAVMLPLFGVVAYSFLGAAGAERLDALLGQLENAQDEDQRAAVMAEVLPLLEAEARRRDPDGAYRFLLARVYSGEQRFPESAATYAEVAELYPEDATILAQYAQALYLAGGRKITPAVQEVIDRALAIDPAQVTLLGLLGMDRFQSGNFAGAVEAWEKLLANLPPDAPDASVIRDGVSAARERLAASGQVVPEPAAGEGKAASAEGPRLEVRVELSPELQAGPDTLRASYALGRGTLPGLGVAQDDRARRHNGHGARFAAIRIPRGKRGRTCLAWGRAHRAAGRLRGRCRARCHGPGPAAGFGTHRPETLNPASFSRSPRSPMLTRSITVLESGNGHHRRSFPQARATERGRSRTLARARHQSSP
jgi:cytochrome c-type biogenesis protein CcmH